ncbi:MAG: putative transposase [Pirellulaceae bacterium]|jgi:putative transposase
MPRPKRADEVGAIYHALNRGNARSTIFHKPEDYDAFERILAEGLELHSVDLISCQLVPNHWHLVLRPNEDGAISQVVYGHSHDAVSRALSHFRRRTRLPGPVQEFPGARRCSFLCGLPLRGT